MKKRKFIRQSVLLEAARSPGFSLLVESPAFCTQCLNALTNFQLDKKIAERYDTERY